MQTLNEPLRLEIFGAETFVLHRRAVARNIKCYTHITLPLPVLRFPIIPG